MAERELFQIGEVARMYHLSVGTLRHYERIGLLPRNARTRPPATVITARASWNRTRRFP